MYNFPLHFSFKWWFFTKVRVNANLFRSSGLFYSCWSKYDWGLNGLDISSNLHLNQFYFQAFVGHDKVTNYNWFHHDLHIKLFFFKLSSNMHVFVYLFTSFIFILWFPGTANSIINVIFYKYYISSSGWDLVWFLCLKAYPTL